MTRDGVPVPGGESPPVGESLPGGETASEPPGEPPLRVDFYIFDEAAATGRLKLACKLAEKAYLAAQSVLIWHSQPEELKALDELLWTFRDGSFVPHDWLTAEAPDTEAPIVLSTTAIPSRTFDVIINLSEDLPEGLDRSRRVIEIIDGDETRRSASRSRFKAYRDRGVAPTSHNIRGEN